jgi:thiamine biosynthesis lipoprotein
MNMARRRFLRIAAATASCGAASLLVSGAPNAAEPAPAIWRGVAMGNLASIEIRHSDREKANRLLDIALAEVERLESIMTLYRPDSALSALNRGGILRDPPLDLVNVLGEARRFGALTNGAFDVTVQPLWQAYASYFGQAGCDPHGPAADVIHAAAARVDYRALQIEPSVVGLDRPGMQVTLNGIAQGYITDRITELLRNEGLQHVLVDLGEIRALGARDPNRPWLVGIENPQDRQRILSEVPLQDRALATSGSYGFKFDATGRFHHIFDPRTGSCPRSYASVTVVAPDATTADALATACNLLTPAEIVIALRAAGAERALLVDANGGQRWIDA